MSAGYSGTPLFKKLGIQPGDRIRTQNAPQNYQELISPVPDQVNVSSRLRTDVDLWHLFETTRSGLESGLEVARERIKTDGMIWVSWPKKSSGVPSEVTEDTIREICLPMGLVDNKVCAIDQIWSGLKLVIRKELRSLTD